MKRGTTLCQGWHGVYLREELPIHRVVKLEAGIEKQELFGSS